MKIWNSAVETSGEALKICNAARICQRLNVRGRQVDHVVHLARSSASDESGIRFFYFKFKEYFLGYLNSSGVDFSHGSLTEETVDAAELRRTFAFETIKRVGHRMTCATVLTRHRLATTQLG